MRADIAKLQSYCNIITKWISLPPRHHRIGLLRYLFQLYTMSSISIFAVSLVLYLPCLLLVILIMLSRYLRSSYAFGD
jgi:hypothetical protein